MAAKKYFWLKLKEDFFRDKKIKKLRRIAGGDTFTIIYLKMQLLSLKREGKLIFEGVEEDFAEEIALEIDEDTDNVKVTIAFLFSNGLLEETDTDEYMLPQAVESIGSESSSAARVRKHRAKAKKAISAPKNAGELPAENGGVLQCNASVTKSNTEIEQELKLKLKKEKETNLQTNPPEEHELTEQEKDHIELIKNHFVSWQVSDHKLLYIYNLAREQIPFEIGMSQYEYDIRIYDGLQKLTMKAKAEDVRYIYAWLQKLIPLTDF